MSWLGIQLIWTWNNNLARICVDIKAQTRCRFFFFSCCGPHVCAFSGTMMDGEHAFATSGGTAWRRQRRLRAFRRYVLWYSKMDVAAAIHHTSRQRTSTTTAATQTVNYASVPAAATYAATGSLPVIERVAPDPAVCTAPAPANEYVASACVIEYVTPAPVTTLLEPPVPAVFAVQVCRETPQSQTLEKIVEIPEIRFFWALELPRVSEMLPVAMWHFRK